MPEPGENFESAARTPPDPGEIRSALERLLNSKAFRAARGQRRFLQYVVEETLAGRGSQLKEFTVGVEAFERGDSFDPRVDPIIRTEARKLRLRLARYYQEEGASEAVRFELPKGSYIPAFVAWTKSEESQPDAVTDVPEMALPDQPLLVVRESPVRRQGAAAVSAYAAAAVLVLLAGSWFVSARERPGTAFDSIAVLPFVNRTGDPGQNALADGMTASLIQRLSHEAGIKVMGRASVSTIRSAASNEAQLRSQLRVKAILSGTIEKSGQGLRLRIRLTDKPRTAAVWSGSYTFEPHLRQLIEAELAAEVVHVLRTGKQADESVALTREKNVPAGAWSAYLEGLHHQDKLDSAGVTQAIASFERATSLDPSFARAWAAMASAWVLAAQISAIPSVEVMGKVRHFAGRAIQLDRDLGEPHFSLAVCAQYEYDWAAAEQEFRTGLALSPSSAVGHLWYARYLALTGRHHEVLVHRTIGAELDPLSPNALQAVAGYWSVKGEYRQAIEGFRAALSLNPNFGLARQGLGMAYLLSGDTQTGIAELEAAAALQGNIRTRSLLGYAYGVAGRTGQARKVLDDFMERERHGPFPALAIAHVYLGLGDKEHAFDWLEKAVDQRDLSATLQWDTLYVQLRSDQRFSRLLRRMRLA